MSHTTQVMMCLSAVLGFTVTASAQQGTITVKESEVTPVRMGKPASAPLDMRPAALCKRQMESEWTKFLADANYFRNMDEGELFKLEARVNDCIPIMPRSSQFAAVSVLQVASYWEGFHNAEGKASELLEKRVDREKAARDSAQAESDAAALHYDGLVDRYNALIRDYNALVVQHNSLIESMQTYMASIDRIFVATRAFSPSYTPPPVIVVPQRATSFNCTAIALPGNSAAINCW